jgi:phage terminase large subunit GpA-like protein
MNALWHIAEELPFDLWSGEQEIVTALPDISTSQFAAENRIVTIGAHQGKWDNDITPYLIEIMDTADLPYVHKLVICGPEQSGKTNGCINIHLKDVVYSGGNAKYIMFPSEVLAKNFASTRLIPIYKACEPIARKMSASPDDTAAGKIVLRDGTVVFPAWGTSASRISSFPADFTWGDEVDKNPDLTGKESDPLKLLEKRTRTFRRFLNLICSTPTEQTGHVWRELQSCDMIMRFKVVCPHCLEAQEMLEERLTWPGQLTLTTGATTGSVGQPEADPKAVKSARSARYVCIACGALWDDIDRNRAVKLAISGKADGLPCAWQPDAEVFRPESVGFHITGFICPDISLSEIAAAMLRGRTGEESDEKERDNSYLGIYHRRKRGGERKEEYILRLCDERIEGQLPASPIAAITAVADMQKRGFWYKITAWGFGIEQESWLLRHGYVDSWEALERVFFKSEFKDTAGNSYRPNLWAIDSGGGESEAYSDMSRTAECYLFCLKNPGVIPFKGNARMQQIYTKTNLDKMPGTNKPMPGIVALHNLNTRIFKNRLASKLMIEPSDPGAWHLHSGLREEDIKMGHPFSLGKEYLRPFATQMCAETLNGINWENPTKRANHLWDCGCYELALCEIAQVKFWSAPNSVIIEEKPIAKKQKTRRW